MPPLLGVETEYTIGGAPERFSGRAVGGLLAAARRHLPHLPDSVRGVFLGSGARFYIDNGNHPEWCTPECTGPADAVCHVRAGERHLEMLLRHEPGAVLLRSNVGYAAPRTTWGCHESHLFTCVKEDLARLLLPHLLTRVIYSGAGGLDPFHPGIVFAVSPRALFFDRPGTSLKAVASLDGREEALARGRYRRAHVVLGESLCLDLAFWLRLATTSLLVTLADAGAVAPAEAPGIESPAAVLRTVALDTSLSAPLAGADSGCAMDIQRRYLALVESRLDHPAVPPWGAVACARWRAVLEALEGGTAPAARCCDWVLKRHLMGEHLRRRGVTAERLAAFNDAVQSAAGDACAGRLDADPALRRRLLECARGRGFSRADVQGLQEIRAELVEIDVRFGMLPGGICAALPGRAAGHVPEVSVAAVRRAMAQPPRDTRARPRGRAVQRLHGRPGRYAATWMSVEDTATCRSLDLTDPFTRQTRWTADRARRSSRIDDFLDQVSLRYNQGDYRRLHSLIRRGFAAWGVDSVVGSRLQTYEAWLRSRTGNVRAALVALDFLRRRGGDSELALKHASVYRFQGLAPRGALWRWIRRCEVEECDRLASVSRANLLGHRGYALGRSGRVEEAVRVLRQAVALPVNFPNHQRIIARNRCDLADCLRILGRRDEAQAELDAAREVLATNGYRGELADHWMLTSARLSADRERATRLLRRARRIQQAMGNPIGVVRSTLLLARLRPSRAMATRCRRTIDARRRRVPDLRECPRLAEVLRHWDLWSAGRRLRAQRDRFWLV